LARAVRAGDRVLIDDGAIELRVIHAQGRAVVTRVVRGGILRAHKGMNLPGRDLGIPALTAKDRADLAVGLEHGVDFIALSFVRRPGDLRLLKRILRDAGKPVPVIAKLERTEAVRNLAGILAESSAVMVARGDLGVEMSPERVPLIQKIIIRQANACGCPVITATQMLESMIQNRQPTRAEASDVANAILDGTDAVMLSGETAAGAYPVEALAMMARIACAAEGGDGAVIPAQPGHAAAGFAHALSHAARQIAHDDPEVKAIACYTKSGMTARLVSSDRPGLPIYAFAPDARVRSQLALHWGVTPLACPLVTDFEQLLRFMDQELLQRQLLRRRDGLVVLAGAPLAFRNLTNSLRLHRLGEVRPAGR
jgi:pyruvate kinase